jgi:hypothetical protein
MDELNAWASEAPDRHFTVSRRTNNIETQWRVLIWERAEGCSMTRRPGCGVGGDADSAFRMAKKSFAEQRDGVRLVRAWFIPVPSFHEDYSNASIAEALGEL